MKVKVGTFTGTGSSQSITGVGFQPDLVLVKNVAASNDTWFKTKDMAASQSIGIRSDGASDTNHITAIGTDGFTVSSDNAVNQSTNTIHYLCIKDDGGGDFACITYTGDNTDDKLVFSAFKPDFAVLKSDSGIVGAMKFSGQASALATTSSNIASMNFQGAGYRSELIGFLSGGLYVSKGNSGNLVNVASTVHYGFAFKNKTGTVASLDYTGNGTSQTVATGFTPLFYIGHQYNANSPVFAFGTQTGGNSQAWDGAQYTGNNLTFSSSGVSMGSGNDINQSGIEHFGIAIASTSSALSGAETGTSTMTAAITDKVPIAGAFAGTSTMTAAMVAPQVVFTSGCSGVSGDFDSNPTATGDTSATGNAGTGYLGKSIHQVLTITANAETSFRRYSRQPSRISQFWYKADSAATISTTVDHCIHALFSDTGFATAITHIRLIGSGTGYVMRTVDPNNSYAASTGSTVLTKGSWNRIVVQVTDTQIKLYLNNGTTPEVTYTPATGNYSGINIMSALWGRYFSQGYTGTQDIDEIWMGNLITAPTTAAGKTGDGYQGYLQKYLAYDGAIVRPPTEGNNAGYTASAPDVVSEGIAYGLKLAVQNNDQATFKLIDNWTLANLLRSNSTVGNTQSNAAPTNALNLMAFHYNSSNSDGKGAGTIYDANWAGDADPERAQALLWAHARWGSSALTVGVTGELAAPNYLQRALNVISDLRTYAFGYSASTTYYYLLNDSFQTGTTVQLAPDYNNPAAFKLFAQYDSSNAAFWNSAVLGAYDTVTKGANYIFTTALNAASANQSTTAHLTPDWLQFNLTTAAVSGVSTYGDSNYSYNAFRAYARLYDAYRWYAESGALTALQLPKSFFVSEWGTTRTGSPLIEAEYYHDGTIKGAYEKTMFYWAAYWSIYANDTSNTTAAAILSGKLTNKYTQSPVGSYYDNGGYAYFDQSWSIVNEMTSAGLYTNYGQGVPVAGVFAGTSGMTAALTDTEPDAGAFAGVGTMVAAISDSMAVAGSFAGTSSMVGAILDKEALAASFSGTSTMVAALTDAESVAAAFVDTSSMAAAISDQEAESAAFGGTSAFSGALIDTVPLAGVFAGMSSMVAAFNVVGAGLSGSFVGSSVMTGALTDAETESSAFAGTSSMVAAMSVSTALSAIFSGTSAFAGAIIDKEAEAGSFSGSGTMVGAITDSEALSALFSGSSAMTASLTDAETDGGTFSGTSSMVAALSVLESMAGAFSGNSAMTAAITEAESLIASFLGSSAMTAAIKNSVPLSGSFSGTSNFASVGALDYETLVASFSGSSAMSSVLLKNTCLVAASAAGTSSMSAALNVMHTSTMLLLGVG